MGCEDWRGGHGASQGTYDGGVTSVGFSPDGTHIVSGSWDKTIRIWDARTGKEVMKPLKGHTSNITSVGFSPDGTHIVSGSDDKTIRIWDARTGEEVVKPLKGHTGRHVTSVGFSPDGTHIVSSSWDGTVRIWDARTGEEVMKPLKGHTKWVTSVGFSPDGNLHRVGLLGQDDPNMGCEDRRGGHEASHGTYQ
jgi:WD40 repeat protein